MIPKDLKDQIIEFSKFYSKLTRPIFPTIRYNSNHGSRGDKVAITLKENKLLGKATIIGRSDLEFKEVPEDLLIYDTDSSTRDQAICELRKFYPDLTHRDQVEIYFLLWRSRGF